MIKIENVEAMGWEAAIRGMRNPMNSWKKSDSGWRMGPVCREDALINKCKDECPYYKKEDCENSSFAPYTIGRNDLSLMTRLRNAGTDHRKFMRMITVYLDITAPLYWWKEFDTYKVGTVANSCSTMHKIADKEFEESDFSVEHILDAESEGAEFPTIYGTEHPPIWALNITIKTLNFYREKYLRAKESGADGFTLKRYWWQMIQLLPSSYNQRRTVMLNYEVLANIYKSRRNHKLDEWNEFCRWIKSLPYAGLITGDEENGNTK